MLSTSIFSAALLLLAECVRTLNSFSLTYDRKYSPAREGIVLYAIPGTAV